MATPVILLVDNIPDHAVRYEATLKEHGYRVYATCTGADALVLAREVRPSCTVIDMRLPDMSSWELCSRLKSQEATRETPVVMLTPDTSRLHAIESARVQCNAWIALPTQAVDLIRVVEQVLAKEAVKPGTPDDAVLGVSSCPVCESDYVRATLRVSPIQYYACRACGHGWRIEAV
jgi:CheY-like chemotaxis protein